VTGIQDKLVNFYSLGNFDPRSEAGSGAKLGALRKVVFSLLLLTGWCLSAGPAFAEKRVALVIGNSSYDTVPRLANPSNDAALMAETFKAAGFDNVALRPNLKLADMRRALRDFLDTARDADVAVIYYAGHGIEVDGINYLIPVDAVLDRDVDIYDEGLSLDRVLIAVEPARQLRLVILDACRDNPFTRSMKRTVGSRSVGRGLAKIEPTNPNTLIAFASKAGSTASDGDGKDSPFATALAKHVTKPGLDLRKAFGYVRDDVLKATGNRQEPYVYGSLGGDDFSLVPAKPVANGPQADPQTAVRRDYELSLQAGDRDAWEAFLRTYPEGFYADLAKVQLKKIAAEEARAATAEKARLAEQEKTRLALEGARQAEVAKAAAAAKAAEEARIAAEKTKQIEQEKAAAAETARLADQEKARVAKEKAEQTKQEKAAATETARLADQEKARIAKEKAEQENAATAEQAKEAAKEQAKSTAQKAENQNEQIAALSPPADQSDKPQDKAQVDLPRSLQAELHRVGCNISAVDGNWNTASQKALDLFNKQTGMKLEVKSATIEALDAVKARTGRICPLICDTGYRADGDRCVKIVCRAGYALNDDGACEKIEVKKPVAKREEPKPKREPSERAKLDAVPAKPQASGQITCNSQGCQAIPKNCHRVANNYAGSGFAGRDNLVCN
jgi:hypothetical protein